MNQIHNRALTIEELKARVGTATGQAGAFRQLVHKAGLHRDGYPKLQEAVESYAHDGTTGTGASEGPASREELRQRIVVAALEHTMHQAPASVADDAEWLHYEEIRNGDNSDTVTRSCVLLTLMPRDEVDLWLDRVDVALALVNQCLDRTGIADTSPISTDVRQQLFGACIFVLRNNDIQQADPMARILLNVVGSALRLNGDIPESPSSDKGQPQG